MTESVTRTCTTCEHCDTDEATDSFGNEFAGVCTMKAHPFHGELVTTWMAQGCPDYEAREAVQ